MTTNHRVKASEYLALAERWGFQPEILQRIGALVVLWGIFETQLEPTVWALRDEVVAGKRPSTDGAKPGELIRRLGEGAPKLGDTACGVLKRAATAASNLMHYRHSLIHGHMIPSQEMPSFLRNASWHGEHRKSRRQTGEAFVTENLLDIAIDSAGTLCHVLFTTQRACRDETSIDKLAALESDVARADSQTGELRYLVTLMNHEKY